MPPRPSLDVAEAERQVHHVRELHRPTLLFPLFCQPLDLRIAARRRRCPQHVRRKCARQRDPSAGLGRQAYARIPCSGTSTSQALTSIPWRMMVSVITLCTSSSLTAVTMVAELPFPDSRQRQMQPQTVPAMPRFPRPRRAPRLRPRKSSPSSRPQQPHLHSQQLCPIKKGSAVGPQLCGSRGTGKERADMSPSRPCPAQPAVSPGQRARLECDTTTVQRLPGLAVRDAHRTALAASVNPESCLVFERPRTAGYAEDRAVWRVVVVNEKSSSPSAVPSPRQTVMQHKVVFLISRSSRSTPPHMFSHDPAPALHACSQCVHLVFGSSSVLSLREARGSIA